MRTRIATALSVSGVLVAGGIAALVNTHVLDSTSYAAANTVPADVAAPSSEPSTTMGATVISRVPATINAGHETASTTAGSVGSGEVASTVPTSPVDATATTVEVVEQDVQVGDAGVVTIDQAGDALTLVNVAPSPGWTLVSSNATAANQVGVVLRSATTEVTFTASSTGGVLQPDVQARSLVTAAPGGGDDDHHGDDDGGHEEGDDD